MNKLIVPNGGMPLYGDDFAFLDSANRDALKGLLYEIALPYNGYLILGGCVISTAGANITISPGYLLVNYEVCYFAGITYASGLGPSGSFALVPFFDPTGLKIFANSTSQDTYQIRVVTFNPGPIADGPLDIPGMVRLSESLYQLIQSYQTTTQAFTMLNGWTKFAGADEPVCYRHFKQVSFVGAVVPGTLSNTSATKVTILPAGFRPVKRVRGICSAQGLSVLFGSVAAEVLPNGDVLCMNLTEDNWDLVYFNIVFQTP